MFVGILTWLGLILPVFFSFFWPSFVAVYILLFDLYWVLRAFYMSNYLRLSYIKMKRALHTNYRQVLEAIEIKEGDPKWQEVYQVVMFATFREELDTLLPSVQSVVDADWPNQKVIIMLAGEESDAERLDHNASFLKEKFKGKIFDFIYSKHPSDIIGEVRGKGAGSAWAGRRLSEYVSSKGIDESKVLVTIADADTRFHRQYFNAICCEFLKNPDRHRRTYQPIPLYSNNIWYAPTISRLAAWGSSFWQMIEASRPWRLVNFSTHSYSLKMLREMDYWDATVVNEDSRQFWRAYFAFDGNHKAVPIYIPVYMDAVVGESLSVSLGNLYKQKRRWAYGVEHLPYIVTESIKNKKIPFWDKWCKIFRLVQGSYDWVVASMHLMFVGWLPIIFSESFRTTVLAYNYPDIARIILSIAWLAAIMSVYTSLSFLPPRPRGFGKMKYFEMVADWIVTPLSAIFFSSIPALEAQTRLMLGKYMGFWVTPKKSVK
ncbi:MAG: hypothetical protein BWY43_00616 [candidate division WS2 bacterium ADurb.Bin280]|uniref:Glycosyltransferase 2-like domain-containing protein n=1 Tax=candidate division WS2 bacterium ADurb.Bin280 TaxID=1852829 RepID=A0A1V5SDN3_9BACT|nr:MAG: hypothetical protein BWY43_00616 [candidate division WS2 bacterium ADurb.Bin280]